MTPETWQAIINNVGMLGAECLIIIGIYKALDNYWEKRNDRAIAIAKEKSAGEQAVKIIEADIAAIEKEIEELKQFRGEAKNDYTLINALVLKLREDYKFIMERMFPTRFDKPQN